MADIIDMAQRSEALEIRAALSRARGSGPGRGPEIIDGVACCRECGEPIPPARLRLVPGCERCRECQEAADG